MEANFSGYATKAGLKCSDGRTIMPEAFTHMDGKKVPLVWQHGHGDSKNVLGHAILQSRDDGVYAYCYLNDGDSGKSAKTLVQHGDITHMSIYANQLVEKAKSVYHGFIREVSLVLSGANPGALIDNISFAHSDGDIETLDDEAVIYTGIPLTMSHSEEDENDEEVVHEEGDDKTVGDIYESLTEEQKAVVHYMIGVAISNDSEDSAEQSSMGDPEEVLNHQEGNDNMVHNVFENTGQSADSSPSLSHADVKEIVADAQKTGSLKESVEAYALKHGIEDIDVLFPDAKAVSDTPEWDKRRTEWVAGVLNGTHHSPFSRIKSLSADLTHEEARAKGYITGNMKKEEFFKVAKRVTTPTTIYKKQKLDRDDIVDITDFNVVSWLKGEMRLMLDEELARAVLIGDGRSMADEDKVNEDNIRPIATDNELFVTQVYVNVDDANSNPSEIVDQILLSRKYYKGTGTPTFYTTETTLTKLLLAKDTLGRRLYRNTSELADELRVSKIVPVEVMEDEQDLVGIIVNLSDYNLGADRGGDVSMFDDFDIDYNQYKYLLETRVSGALTKVKSALVINKVAGSAQLVEPVAPSFDQGTDTVTVNDTTGVIYTRTDTGATVTSTTPIVLDSTTLPEVTIQATPDTGYYFATSANDSWTFQYSA